MPGQSLKIWCNAHFNEPALTALREGAASHELAFDGPDGFPLAQADVAFGQPDPATILAGSAVRWIHITSAGYTRYDRDDLRHALQQHGTLFTNSSHVYDDPCAQHVLAMMLAFARQLLPSYESQRTVRDWQGGPRRAASFLLTGQSVLLLGFGAIGQRLVQLLAPFEMRVIAVRRQVQHQAGVEVVTEAELPSVLGEVQHVVNILPDNSATQGFVNAERLNRLRPGAFFYNVGRGTTVDQTALIAALQAGQLAAAYLDVTDPEPLPPEHPLWATPHCYITPHTAGGHQGEQLRLVRHFLANLAAFEQGQPLQDRVF